MTDLPAIAPLAWADIRTVLPTESAHFTPWLGDNLELLADVLGLEGLELVDIEDGVDELRLDIRAVGEDAAGTTFAVAIENQYGRTDHDHLGKLITYAAHAYNDDEVDRVLAVWVTEDVRDAHLAAVEFLNRTSPDAIGYVIVSPRFVKGVDGFLVHFEIHTEPNEFLRSGRPPSGQVPAERTTFMHGVHGAAGDAIKGLGYRRSWVHPDGWLIRYYLPRSHPLASWAEVRVRATKRRFRLAIVIDNSDATLDEAQEVLSTIRAQHASSLASLGEIDWDSPGAGPIARAAWARLEISDFGYENGDVAAATGALVQFAEAFMSATAADDPALYPDPLGETVPRADTESVIAVTGLLQAGEWTTYGDVSTAIRGDAAASMAVGGILASNADVPNPHRVLNAGGVIPPKWTSSNGEGPEECIRRLESEGVTVTNNKAAPSRYVPAETLIARLAGSTGSADLP